MTKQTSPCTIDETLRPSEIEDATHIVALGGDGHMLHVLQDTLSFGLPVFGMNCGRLGFLMNEYSDTNLTDRIAAAHHCTALRMRATAKDGVMHEALAINEVSLLRQDS